MKKRNADRGKRASKRRSASRKASKISVLPQQRPRLGLEATVERIVEIRHTIQSVDPNLPAVFSTPSMIGLMEHATVQAVQPELPPGTITVGTRIEVDHLKAVPPGATVHASARFVRYKGRFLVFEVEARSGEHLIGRGRVSRAIVNPEAHGTKAQTRVQQ
ncbi:MAG TPA: hotdog domain-containing protein [Candidatus Acidoferrales bacterium]|nr:hotdog domain-containing protein [Candidatus Acidoferrales bacterium]